MGNERIEIGKESAIILSPEKMKIPFHKADIGSEEESEVLDSLRSGWLTMGPKTVKFEEKFRDYIGARHSVALNSCTAALHLALEAVGLKEGDEVLVPAMTFTASAEVVCYFKGKPVLVDVERDTHNLNAGKIEEKITPRTKVIIPVHYGGQPADLDEIGKIAAKHGLKVIEDAAHALPSWYRGRKIGTIGDLTCFSFYATKTLAAGEGGMVTTGNKKWADRIKTMRLHGMNRDAWKRYAKGGSWFYQVVEAGFKYNPTDIQSSLGIVQLRKLEDMWRKRKAIAGRYDRAFKDREEVTVPFRKSDRVSSWHLYPIKLYLKALSIDRNEFIEELAKRGVSASVHFIPLYRHPFYRRRFGYRVKQFPDSEWVYQRIISLPIYPSMTEAETDWVIGAIDDVVTKKRR